LKQFRSEERDTGADCWELKKTSIALSQNETGRPRPPHGGAASESIGRSNYLKTRQNGKGRRIKVSRDPTDVWLSAGRVRQSQSVLPNRYIKRKTNRDDDKNPLARDGDFRKRRGEEGKRESETSMKGPAALVNRMREVECAA